jgi:hypothetical protein
VRQSVASRQPPAARLRHQPNLPRFPRVAGTIWKRRVKPFDFSSKELPTLEDPSGAQIDGCRELSETAEELAAVAESHGWSLDGIETQQLVPATLFVGPAGAGKSTLAAQYLCGAANPAAKAAIFLFDERLKTFVARCDALGMRATERIASGQLIPQQVDPGVTSPGEFAHRVRRLVDDEGVRLIGIDSVNGYLNAIPTTDAPIVRMHELLSFLNERSVGTLITLAQHRTVGELMPSPVERKRRSTLRRFPCSRSCGIC